MSYKKITPKMDYVWKPETGDSLQGQLVKIEEKVGSNNSMMYSIQQKDGTLMKVWGSTVLDSLMKDISLGNSIEILFEGLKLNPKTNREFKMFTVGVEE